MWAVFYRAQVEGPFRDHPQERTPRIPRELEPMQLEEAVEKLLEGGKLVRQWRALTVLLLHGFHTVPRRRPLLQALFDRIEGEDDAFGIKLENFDRNSRQAVLEVFRGLYPSHGCCTVPIYTSTESDERDVTRATVEVRVRRRVSELRNACDAQAWDDCSESFLDATKAVLDGTTWHRDSVPLGTPWHGEFFEHVFSGPTWRNLLNIDYAMDDRESPSRLFLGYSLYRSIDVQWWSYAWEAPILRDRGYALALRDERDPLYSVVKVVKEIKYRDLTEGDQGAYDWGQIFNSLAPAMLAHWIQAGLLETLCCEPIGL